MVGEVVIAAFISVERVLLWSLCAEVVHESFDTPAATHDHADGAMSDYHARECDDDNGDGAHGLDAVTLSTSCDEKGNPAPRCSEHACKLVKGELCVPLT